MPPLTLAQPESPRAADWQPVPGEEYACACGCGEMLTYSGVGRPQLYVNDTHKKRAYRARKKAEQAATQAVTQLAPQTASQATMTALS